MTRRRLLTTIADATLACGLYSGVWETNWFEVSHTTVRLSGEPLKSPVRILHLSDFHVSYFVGLSMIENAIEAGLRQKPDLICVTGDFITDRSRDFDDVQYAALLKRLTQAAPTFASLGNHDGGPWSASVRGYSDHKLVDRLLENAGIELLLNRNVPLDVRDQSLTLIGLGDIWNHEMDASAAWKSVTAERPIVLLSHNPDSKDLLPRVPWNLMLSGHTHGGQVIIPFDGPRFAPVNDKRYVAGLKPWRDRQIYVSRGVGNLGGVRFNCRPEVSLLTLS